MNSIEHHKKICNELTELYSAKNADYGNSFKISYDHFGILAGLVRMSDKYHRLINLANREACVADESIRDTLIDLANYCIMTVMEMEEAE